jgi:hypothetical protein
MLQGAHRTTRKPQVCGAHKRQHAPPPVCQHEDCKMFAVLCSLQQVLPPGFLRTCCHRGSGGIAASSKAAHLSHERNTSLLGFQGWHRLAKHTLCGAFAPLAAGSEIWDPAMRLFLNRQGINATNVGAYPINDDLFRPSYGGYFPCEWAGGGRGQAHPHDPPLCPLTWHVPARRGVLLCPVFPLCSHSLTTVTSSTSGHKFAPALCIAAVQPHWCPP